MADSMIKSCIISCKGGVPLDRINRDYKELIGEDIPFKANGFTSLNGFLLSIEGITIENGMVRASSNETAHLEEMIGKQKLKKQAVKLKRYKNNNENIPTYKRNLTLPKPTSSNNVRATSFNQSTNNNHRSYNLNKNYKNFQYYQEPHFRNNHYKRNSRYNVNSFKGDIRDNHYNRPHLYSENPYEPWQRDQYHHGRRSDENCRSWYNNNSHNSYGIRNHNKTIVNYDNDPMSYWSRQYSTYLYLSQFY